MSVVATWLAVWRKPSGGLERLQLRIQFPLEINDILVCQALLSFHIELQVLNIGGRQDGWNPFAPGIANLKVDVRVGIGEHPDEDGGGLNLSPHVLDDVACKCRLIDSLAQQIILVDGRLDAVVKEVCEGIRIGHGDKRMPSRCGGLLELTLLHRERSVRANLRIQKDSA